MAAQEPIEGTILTEGLGVGRGTRIEDAKGTVRLDTGGKESGIRGGQGGLDQSAVITIDGREAQVRARAINPLEVKPLITDGEGISSHAILRAGEILSKSAFDYANRVSDLKADAAVVAFNQKARQWFYGSDDGSTPGFNALKGQSAVDARQKEFARVDNDMSDIIASVDPEVRQKAAARLQGIRDQALNRASSHIVQAQQEAEIEMKFIKLQDSERDRVNDFTRPDIDQATFLSHFGSDYKEGKIQWDVSTVKVAKSIYLKERKTGGSGLQKLQTFIDLNSPTVGVEARNRLADLVKEKTAEEERVSAYQIARAKEKKKEEEKGRYWSAISKVDKDENFRDNANSLTFLNSEAGIQNPEHAKAIASYAEAKYSGKEVIRNNKESFYLNIVVPAIEAGEVIPITDFTLTAMKYGVPQENMNYYYDQMTKPLDQDEKVLIKQVSLLCTELNRSFKSDKSGAFAASFYSLINNKPLDPTEVGENDPPLLKELKVNLMAISQDKSLGVPRERSIKVTEYMEKMKGVHATTPELKNMPATQVFSRAFNIAKIQKEALDIATEKNTVIQEKKKANEITPLMQAAASITGVLPNKRAVDLVAEKAYKIKGVIPNSLFLDVVNGESFLAVKVEDGPGREKVQHLNKATPKPIEKPVHDYSDFEAVKVKIDAFKQDTLNSISKDMEDEFKELSKHAKETGKQNTKRLDEWMNDLYNKLTPQQKKDYDEELSKRMEKLKKAK